MGRDEREREIERLSVCVRERERDNGHDAALIAYRTSLSLNYTHKLFSTRLNSLSDHKKVEQESDQAQVL